MKITARQILIQELNTIKYQMDKSKNYNNSIIDLLDSISTFVRSGQDESVEIIISSILEKLS